MVRREPFFFRYIHLLTLKDADPKGSAFHYVVNGKRCNISLDLYEQITFNFFIIYFLT